MKVRSWLITLVALSVTTALAACGPPADDDDDSDSGASGGVDAKTATSLEDFGDMDALVKAAQEEGTLNVIALPPDWANYGAITEAFTAKYGIAVNSANPEGSSQDEINAVQQLGTQDRAPAGARALQARGIPARPRGRR